MISSQTNAVHLSSDGKGDVLIFPYYTVNGGFITLVNFINTTDQAKALRVRFREAANGREVCAFNLYLGANGYQEPLHHPQLRYFLNYAMHRIQYILIMRKQT